MNLLAPLCTLLLTVVLSTNSYAQLWTQDFEISALGTQYFCTSVFTNSPNAHYNRTNGSNISNATAPYDDAQGLYYWAGENLDDNTISGDGLNEKLISFPAIVVTGLTQVEFRGLFATGNFSSGWDYTDAFYVEYQDGIGPWTKILQFASPGLSGNSGLFLDSDFDGIGEGPALTQHFEQFSAVVPVSGTTIQFRIFTSANGTGEEFAFDYLRLYNSALVTAGCTDPGATNFNSVAVVDDGSCSFLGCTNSSALNFDPQATIDNGTCISSVPAIVINEIHYNPSSYAGFSDIDFEFIELYNQSSSVVNLTGWRLSQAVDFTFPTGASIGSGGYVVIASNSLTYAGNGYPVYQYSGSLSNSGDLINLVEVHGIIVDHVEYFPNPSWPSGADSNGPSLELINDFLDNTDPLSWCSGVINNGTPGVQNTCYSLIPGCNDGAAANFNPLAQVNDGSCLYPGCTYAAATNFSAGANLDNGSCIFDLTDPCPSDLNNDGIVGTADLLVFVANYGTSCQ